MLQSHLKEYKKMNSAVLPYTIPDPVTLLYWSHLIPSPDLFVPLFYPGLLSVSLQVEQLFCLGLRSRPECLKLLEMCDWNLEVASTQMLDNYGSTTRQRYCAVFYSFVCLTLGPDFPHRHRHHCSWTILSYYRSTVTIHLSNLFNT